MRYTRFFNVPFIIITLMVWGCPLIVWGNAEKQEEELAELQYLNPADQQNDPLERWFGADGKLGKPVVSEAVQEVEMVRVTGGCFKMGQSVNEKAQLVEERGLNSYQEHHLDELPQHEVCVKDFYMSKYEVTNSQYRSFRKGHSSGNERGKSLDGATQPVVFVSWNDTQEYISWLNKKSGKKYRLPTEAEWEYAARGGTDTIRYWGDNINLACKYSNVRDYILQVEWPQNSSFHSCHDGFLVSAFVGSNRPNEFGLYDMLGNVWEWTSDFYSKDYYIKSTSDNPKGPITGTSKVRRGGSWENRPAYVRSAARGHNSPDFSSNALGFRLVLSVD